MIKLVILDLGNTLIHQIEDLRQPLDRLPIRPIEGAVSAVRRVASDYQVAILSNTHRTTSKQLRKALRHLGVGDMALRAFTSVSLGRKKPDARAFQHVLLSFGVPASEAVMVGDSFEEDIAGAKAVGIRTIWVSDAQLQNDPTADLVIRRLSDLTPELIHTLDQGASISGLPPAPFTSGDVTGAMLPPEGGRPDIGAVPAIVELEAGQDWRRIGLAWLNYARSIKPAMSAEAEKWLHHAKPDAAAHHFPTISPSDASWMSLSALERAARAFRYAGYHFEEDRDQQTTFLHYYRSAECFWEAEKSAEAARSYYLALMSFVRRYGQLDDLLLSRLQRAYEVAVSRDEAKYLPPIVVQYRRLGAALRAAGNFAQHLRLRRMRLNMERQLARVQRRWLRYGALSAWRITSTYGQSIMGWCSLFAVANLFIFPVLYILPGVATTHLTLTQAEVFALGRMIAYSPFEPALTTLGHLLTIMQAMFTLVWISVLASIIVTRSQE